jgi:hypothetical protein
MNYIEDYLASYSANGLLDVGKFYDQIAWFNSNLGLSLFERKDTMITLTDHKGQLPCDFMMLDSAWLCKENHRELENETYNGKEIKPFHWREFQDKIVVYTHKDCEMIQQPGGICNQPTYGVYINGCAPENVIEKVTIKEYVEGNSWANANYEWNFTPRLLKLGNKLTETFCHKHCKNFKGGGVHDISIRKQGNTYYVFSNLKHPMMFIRYYSGPFDEKTGLPLVGDHPVLLQALRDYLILFFFEAMWSDSQDVNLENKLKYWNEKSAKSMAEARFLSKLPSFNKLVEDSRRLRNQYYSYERMNVRHF